MKGTSVVLFLFAALFGSGLLKTANAQSVLEDSVVNVPILYVDYGFHFPSAHLAERFGYHSTLGAGWKFKIKKNWLIDLDGHFIFGGQVKENQILNHLSKEGAFTIFASNGFPAEIIFNQRGFFLRGQVGKVIPVTGYNKNSGILVMAGGGFMQHKIKISVNRDQAVPQLTKEYLKGYDRLTNGLMTSFFVGYFHLSNNKRINFFAGFEAIQGYTQSRRSWNYDTNTRDDRNRLDLMTGFRGGWMIPIYRRQTEKFYYY